ncbi:MAG: hypothetical protein M3Y87_02690 [Myxococcota bacterium]|nr:hypothetical protein [Myxococcota bacterium]
MIASAAIGCTTGAPSVDPATASIVVRTGDSCAAGCPLDRPLLVGGEVIAEVIAEVDADSLEVRATDPTIVSAWIEPVRLCCGSGEGGTCRVMALGETECGGEQSQRRRVVMRALRVGQSAIELIDASGVPFETVPVAVEDAVEVNAIATIVPYGDLDDVVIGGPLSDPWIDGRIERLDLRAGELARLRMVAIAPSGLELFVGSGAAASVADPSIARIGPASRVCSGALAQGPRLEIEAVAPGVTAVTMFAGSAQSSFEVVVSGACEPLGEIEPTEVACESDADCVPAGCCHPTTCTAAAQAPSCGGTFCTLECRAGTLDCGGRCLCLEGRCAAYIPSLADPSCSLDDPGGPAVDPSDIPAGRPGPF